jgi:hypothetical protein
MVHSRRNAVHSWPLWLSLGAALQHCFLIDYTPVRDGGTTGESAPDGGDATVSTDASWWTDSAVTNRCEGPMCDMMCHGQDCVFECGGAAPCVSHCMAESRCYAHCGGSLDCQLRCDAMSSCSFACNDSAMASCTAKCDPDTHCLIDCTGVAKCAVQCEKHGSCEIDCRGTASCAQLKCDKEATCLAYCSPGSACSFDCLDGQALSCPGGIITCNRDCP